MPLSPLRGRLAAIEAYMADISRGKPIAIRVPDDPRALAAYEEGKRQYFTHRGPRGFACYHGHWEAARGAYPWQRAEPGPGPSR